MEPIKIFIPGQPQGKERARSRIVTNKTTGKQFTSHYTPSKTKKYENLIESYAIGAMIGRELIKGPIKLTMLFMFEISPSWAKWKRELALDGEILPTVKPDSDNIEKAIKDALNGVVWVDDQQVCKTAKDKRYSSKPGVYVVVEPINKLSAQVKRKPVLNNQELDLAS